MKFGLNLCVFKGKAKIFRIELFHEGVQTTYIFLCDLLMDVHVSQSQTQIAALSNNGAVRRCALLRQSGHSACVLTGGKKKRSGGKFHNARLKKIIALELSGLVRPTHHVLTVAQHCVAVWIGSCGRDQQRPAAEAAQRVLTDEMERFKPQARIREAFLLF